MIKAELALEEAAARMGEAYAAWTADCEKCHRCQDSAARIKMMSLSHQRFLAAVAEWLRIAEEFGIAVSPQPGM